MSDSPPRRVFTYEEARRLLPSVRQLTSDAVEKINTLEIARDESENRESHEERMRESAGEILAAWARSIEALGIEVKGPWLIDFDSGAGYYCWKWPEESLEFFHGYDEGFSGRVRIQ